MEGIQLIDDSCLPDAFQALCLLPVFQLDLTGIELGDMFNTSQESPVAVSLRKLQGDPEFIKEMTKMLVYFDSVGVLDC